MTETDAPPETVLTAPLACWHESLLSARTDRVIALACESAIIATPRPLPVGTRVFLELSLGQASNAARGEIDGVVVDGSLFGHEGFRVRFVELDDALRTWIAHTLRVKREAPAHVPEMAAVEHAPVVDDDASFDPFADIMTPAPVAAAELAFTGVDEVQSADASDDERDAVPTSSAWFLDEATVDRAPDPSVLAEAGLAMDPPVDDAVTADDIIIDAVAVDAVTAVAVDAVTADAVDDITVDAVAIDAITVDAVAVDAVTADADDEPLSISPAEPLRAITMHDDGVHDLGRQFDDAFDLSPFDEPPPAHRFAPPAPIVPSTTETVATARAPLTELHAETPQSTDVDDAGRDGTFTESLGDLDPFDAFDAFNAARGRGTPAHGFASVPPHDWRAADTSGTNAHFSTSPPATPAAPAEPVEPVTGAADEEPSDAFAAAGAVPAPLSSSGRHVTTLRFDGRPVQEELAHDAHAALRAAQQQFPNTHTDPQFGAFMLPRTDPMFPAVHGSDDELKAALARLTPESVSAGAIPSTALPSVAPDPLPIMAPRPATTSLDAAQLEALRNFGLPTDGGEDIVEVSSTSELVEVARGPDGTVTAIEARTETVAQETEDIPELAPIETFDVDFGDELDARAAKTAAEAAMSDETDVDDLPLVVGSDAAPPRNPFVLDPNLFTRKD